jgi:hypothetical protein
MDEELLPTTPPPALDVPQEMILAIAIGMEEPSEIASRYGFEGDRWKVLSVWKPFLDAVAKQKAELEQNGITFRIKAKALTEDVFEDAYKIARSNDATLLQKLEFIKLGAKLGDMEPKASAQVASGPGFSITINITDPPKKPEVVDVETVEQVEFVPPKLDLKLKPVEDNE